MTPRQTEFGIDEVTLSFEIRIATSEHTGRPFQQKIHFKLDNGNRQGSTRQKPRPITPPGRVFNALSVYTRTPTLYRSSNILDPV